MGKGIELKKGLVSSTVKSRKSVAITFFPEEASAIRYFTSSGYVSIEINFDPGLTKLHDLAGSLYLLRHRKMIEPNLEKDSLKGEYMRTGRIPYVSLRNGCS